MTPDQRLNQVLSAYIGKPSVKGEWLSRAAANASRAREEDRAKGIIWEDGQVSEDWKPGDLAVCVDVSPHPGLDLRHLKALTQLTLGATYRVRGLALSGGLLIAGVQAGDEVRGYGWSEHRFRKVRPDQHEPCEEEFTELLNRSKKQVRA